VLFHVFSWSISVLAPTLARSGLISASPSLPGLDELNTVALAAEAAREIKVHPASVSACNERRDTRRGTGE
jgi:hypothetical protein